MSIVKNNKKSLLIVVANYGSLKSGPETEDPGPCDPETWTLKLGSWALELATLRHGILTPGILVMGPWDSVTSN